MAAPKRNGSYSIYRAFRAIFSRSNGLPRKMDGFRQKQEGLSHIDQHCKERVQAVADVKKRGQNVKVKVQKIENGKMSSDMKEVDQNTGEFPSKNVEKTLLGYFANLP
ncbi:hypothetical protein CAEBREN_21042 [Caenorhabditis brenneri]|uniref:Uncharacterized protein n=1 Tax=Caenorhabditis brenneri TaxID=135651 RepID=G0NN04_CAEBE|nr:hypothetical protein CAEBREN_21042 [Caenorhabditis brenneri]